MKVRRFLRSVWQYWRELWRLDWERHLGVDPHKWESKMEMRRRLASPRR